MNRTVTLDRIVIHLLISCFVLGLFLRLWHLELRPLHHDEGVNGWFLLRLYKDNFLRYDPANFHGPFLFYLGLIPFHVAGVNTFSIRLMPALFGSLMIGLLAPLRRRVGNAGVIGAGALLALSPANVFYSRYIIHETYLVFFTLTAVTGAVLFVQSKRFLYFYLAVASLAFMVTVKETYIITFGVLGISILLAWVLNRAGMRQPQSALYNASGSRKDPANPWSMLWSKAQNRKVNVLISVLVFAAINVLFYSSFFTYFEGVKGLLASLKIWIRTGTGDSGHSKPFLYYLKVLYRFEAPILLFGILGLCFSLRRKDTFSFFTFCWAIGMFLAYSLIPYKTPWLIINLTLPLSLLAGVFLQAVVSSLVGAGSRILFAVLFSVVLGFSAYQTIDLNFRHYDDPSQELVYVHTYRDIYRLVDRIAAISKLASGKRTAINVAFPEQWPLEWYLRDYTGVSYWGKVIDRPDAPIVIAKNQDQVLLESRLSDEYRKESYQIRPGVSIVLYVDQGLWDRWFVDSLKDRGDVELPSDPIVEPGLGGKYYRGLSFTGQPFYTSSDTSMVLTWPSGATGPIGGDFSAVWEGYLWVEHPGVYHFKADSRNESWIYLDETLVAHSAYKNLLEGTAGEVNLTMGIHRIKVGYSSMGKEAFLRLLWKPPETSEGLIPGRVLYNIRNKIPRPCESKR